MPDITYSQDFDSSCIMNDNRGSNHYQNVYLPSFQSSDKSAHMALGHTLPPPTIVHSDVLYGLDTMYPVSWNNCVEEFESFSIMLRVHKNNQFSAIHAKIVC